jgi:MarR family transcriptional regulator, lower aerobic nicotinate degradation pathway regulator
MARTASRKPEPAILPPAIPPALLTYIGFVMNKAGLGIREMVGEYLRPLDIDVRHFAVMNLLDASGPLSQQGIAQFVQCDRTTMVSVIDQLEELKLAERVADPNDRRTNAIHLTNPGKRTLKEAAKLVSRAHEEFLAPLSADERKQLHGLLLKLIIH